MNDQKSLVWQETGRRHVPLSLTDEQWKELEEQAQRNRRTLAGHVAFILEQHLFRTAGE